MLLVARERHGATPYRPFRMPSMNTTPTALAVPAVPAEITDAELTRYAALIYERTGIRVSPKKTTLLSNRLRRRLRETGIATYEAYLAHLKRLPSKDAEWDKFLQEITTHETYLFRDESQWDWFRQTFLAEVAAAARAGTRPKRLRIWSAAASTGDEAMTIASCVLASLAGANTWQIQIVGTDIGVGALEHAQQAVYCERAMRLVPEDYKTRYFKKATNANVWQAKPALTDLVRYRQHNLLDKLAEPPFDLVFVKNVLIYFDQASKQIVLNHVRNLLVPGGLLVAGGAEGISDQLKDFERIQPWLFRRPLAARSGS